MVANLLCDLGDLNGICLKWLFEWQLWHPLGAANYALLFLKILEVHCF